MTHPHLKQILIMTYRRISLQLMLMAQYGLKNPYQTETCIHMAPGKSETSYFSQIPTPLQEPITKSITQEEPMDSTDSDVPYLTNVPKEVLLQD